ANIGVNFFTMTQVEGFGLERGEKFTYRGHDLNSKRIARLKLDIMVPDEQVAKVQEVIISNARTGEPGDGRISVYAIESATRIRTGETGDAAILPTK
ncbi:MAG: P-II family nitrogen regulator, partial [Bacteroidota bacterium]